MLEHAGKSGHIIASLIQQQYNYLLPEKVSKMLCLLNSCEVADFWILSCAAGIYVIVCARVSRVCPKMPPLQIRTILTLNYASMEDGDADVDID